MCGILGLFESNKQLDGRWAQQFIAAAKQIKHRGPDGYGYWTSKSHQAIFNSDDKSIEQYLLQNQNEETLWFAHRRLSIIDLSTNGDQPITVVTKTGKRLVITYNGEIYNYLELRKELEGLGHAFQTATDTEVLLRAYEQWDTDAFNKFNGMWAFALWDEAKNKLMLCRDRFGVKPLHYTFISNTIVFSSEIKQLINFRKSFTTYTQPWNTFRLNLFLNNAQHHNSEETFYNHIYNLRPAHYIQINFNDSFSHEKIKQMPYWDFPDENQCYDSKNLPFDESAKLLRSLLESAVNFRLRSDVPVGSALSGGLDSSSIVQIVSQLTKKSQKTFTAAYKDHPKIDETAFTKLLIANKSLEAHTIYPTKEGLSRDLEDLCYHLDGPFQSSSMYSQRSVFEKSHLENIKVMLDGQGADEVLGGYEGFFKYWAKSLINNHQLFDLTKGVMNFTKSNPDYFRKILSHKLKRPSENFLTNKFQTEFNDKFIEIQKSGDKSL